MAAEESAPISVEETVKLLEKPRALANWIMETTRKAGHDPNVVAMGCVLVLEAFGVSGLKQLEEDKGSK